jgi:hypothetical protein
MVSDVLARVILARGKGEAMLQKELFHEVASTKLFAVAHFEAEVMAGDANVTDSRHDWGNPRQGVPLSTLYVHLYERDLSHTFSFTYFA